MRAALPLRRNHPDVAVLVLSQYIETRYATQLLSGRCDGIAIVEALSFRPGRHPHDRWYA
ncbi:hypothetical protein [Paractinoplanes hotanensis]|uniref:hypothetical protein n=1 Tax=Paractinoplanes hotanensis TaxID=2906497 RepID=UPI0027E36821|nr:hypothetical protein [Actinoplanes hotanensis]